VYCKDGKRRGKYAATSFTFLGFTFRARAARDRNGDIFTSFLPAVSKDALKRMSAELRSWRLHLRTGHTFDELARKINPIVRGWMQYYGEFYRTELYPLLRRINYYLMRWLRKKYRIGTFKKFHRRWKQITEKDPLMFAQWKWVHSIW
jgi:RNA-directed DNA polymerase